jgi:hypothetical protein
VHPSAGDLLDARGEPLGGSVGGVGAHRVAGVVDQMDDQHRADRCVFEQADFEVAGAASESLQHRVDLIRFGQDGLPLGLQRQAGSREVWHVEHLHLGDHLRGGCLRLEARLPGEPGHKGSAGDDRRFLDSHQDENRDR